MPAWVISTDTVALADRDAHRHGELGVDAPVAVGAA